MAPRPQLELDQLLHIPTSEWDHLSTGTVTGAHHYGLVRDDVYYRMKVPYPVTMRTPEGEDIEVVTLADCERLARCEEAAALIGDIIGIGSMIAPCRCGRTTLPTIPAVFYASVQLQWDGCAPPDDIRLLDRDAALRVAVFDVVIRNRDRHEDNLLLTADGDIRLIDNATSFDVWPNWKLKRPLLDAFDGAPLPQDAIDGLERVLAHVPDRVYELIGTDTVNEMRGRVRRLLDAGVLVTDIWPSDREE